MDDLGLDALECDLDEIMRDFTQRADFVAPSGARAIAVPVIVGDLRAEGSANRAAWRDDFATTVTVKASSLPFVPEPGTTIRLSSGQRLRVTDCAATPGDAAYTITVENRGRA